jgi:hypothetical protein
MLTVSVLVGKLIEKCGSRRITDTIAGLRIPARWLKDAAHGHSGLSALVRRRTP